MGLINKMRAQFAKRKGGFLDKLDDYWFKHYAGACCTLCGNSGIIDSRGVRTNAGEEVGRLNFCICPNGRSLRATRRGIVSLFNEARPEQAIKQRDRYW